ncbi:hypothetical protein AQS8620_02800 [Aquimixticola soesokkakensis]|uniref:YgjP-like metallopeptidase domain-containing protein n=1 Tax=Aquimixticola soesokkakensis TaxID=1519096 RepID=A0A1Y5TIT0_9RHOB|nr:SprT family zinc-dependent metalloprotease [Aquimixticola soesokkakensis]SLN61317.1 hypothetical protein AQS8620_02800 [Aquimixticola soesokkakensis]
MRRAILAGNPPLEILLRPSAQGRRLSLRISALDGRVTLSMPKRVREAEAMAFLREKESWIRQNMPDDVSAVVPKIGGFVPFEGQELTLVPAKLRSARQEGAQLLVPEAPDMVGPRVQAFLKLHAKNRLAAASALYAQALGVGFGKITLRDTRSRWGSCTSEGNLMYSWRLIMAPPAVLDYVAAHEVAHLQEMNHSPAYWAVVGQIYPDWRPARKWLHEHGAKLHRWRFTD